MFIELIKRNSENMKIKAEEIATRNSRKSPPMNKFEDNEDNKENKHEDE